MQHSSKNIAINKDFLNNSSDTYSNEYIGSLFQKVSHLNYYEAMYYLLGKLHLTNLLNRLIVNYKIDNKIASVSLNDLKNKIKDGAFSPETIIFNTAINTKGELLNNFEVDIKSSWLSKFF